MPSEPRPGDTIRARRYGNRTRRSYVIDALAHNGTSEAVTGNAYAAFVHPKHSNNSAPTLMVFDRRDLRIIPRKDQP